MINVDVSADKSVIEGCLADLSNEFSYIIYSIVPDIAESKRTVEEKIEVLTRFISFSFGFAAEQMRIDFKEDKDTLLAGLMAGLDCAKGAVVEASGKTMGELQRYLFENVRLNKKEEES